MNQIAQIEAILFSIGDSVPVKALAETLELTVAETQEIITVMQERYEEEDRGVQIIWLEDAVQMCTKPEMHDTLIRIASRPKEHTLTDVVLETLSIIAYKQPVTRIEVEKIRGVSCAHSINKLLEYGLIYEAGRLDTPGRPILFATTEEFLRCFAVHSVSELPVLSEDKMEEFKEEAAKEASVPLNT